MARISTICPNKFAAVHNFSCTHNLMKASYNNLIKEMKSKSCSQRPDDNRKISKNSNSANSRPVISKNFNPNDNIISDVRDYSKNGTDNEPLPHEEAQYPNQFIICFPENNCFHPKAEPEQIVAPNVNSNSTLPTQLSPQLSVTLALPQPPQQPPQQQRSQQNSKCINNYYPLTKKRTRTPFTKEEDNKLKELVQLYSCIEDKSKWYFIANQIPDRSARQCRERFQLFLCDGIRRKEKWTKEEDDLLLSKYSIIGPHWKSMEKFFVGRTSYAIKNRYISLNRQKKHFNSGSSDENSNDYSSNDNGLNNSNVDTKSVIVNIGN